MLLLSSLAPLALIASFTAPFGAGPAQMGLSHDDEASPEAPGSIALDDDGRVFLLDAVHTRVTVHDAKSGALEATIALPSDTIEDIALLPSGDLVALDRLVARTVYVIAPNGAVLATAAVEGEQVADGGEVTALFADVDGVWLEVQRGAQVRVLDANARGIERNTRPGIPMADGKRFVRMRKVGDLAHVTIVDARGVIVGGHVVEQASLLLLAGLAVDGDRIVVAAHELSEDGKRDVIVLTTIGADGRKERRELKASPEFVPMKQLVARAGRVAHLYVDSRSNARGGIEVTSW